MSTVDVIIPVYNEEKELEPHITRLHQFLQEHLPQPWTIVIADNGSTDKTLSLAQALAQKYPHITYIHLPQKGRGRALRQAFLDSAAYIVSFMDVDLSTDLKFFPPLVRAIEEGYHIAIGSRLLPDSRVKRSLKREFTSRMYNLLLRAMFGTKFRDAQCGFKAFNRQAVLKLLPHVQNQTWFFDTELLILAAGNGYRIKELPVEWTEDPGSTVHIFKTATEFLRGLLRMRCHPIPHITPES